jgi:myo-inositol 2-dehydrogenase / D-chiro-inositol 1-dehydrogenase
MGAGMSTDAVIGTDALFAGSATQLPDVLRVGVVGAAGAGVPHLRALAGGVPGARVTLVQDDGDPRRLAELAEHAGADVARHPDGLVAADLDAVVVAGGDPVPVVFACLERGLPAFLVPGRGLDADDVRALVSLEEATGRRGVQVGLVRRHDPAHLALRRAVADGGVGRLRLLRATERGADRRAGLLPTLDSATWLLGEVPTEVSLESDDPSLLTLRTASTLVRLEVDDVVTDGHDLRCEVLGATGVVALADPAAVVLRRGGHVASARPADATARFADATRIGLTAWVRSVRTGRPLGASAWDLHVAVALAEAAGASRLTGDAVAVDPGPRPGLYDPVPHRAL